ncbi:MAG: ribosome maturation factor [Bacteroidetes bacterium]|nr:ribosome maturation factor [Bacteroidota bacterium]MBS1633666.1 ribosome maturation factor [Bacteroidota bacterium]
MNETSQIQVLESLTEELIKDKPGVFLVEIKISLSSQVRIFLDADQGITIEELVQINRNLYKKIVETGVFPGNNFSLEVSSPGLDEPLKIQRQYFKNIGKNVEVLRKDGIKTEGKLKAVNETSVLIEEEKARLTGNNKRNEVGQGKNKKKEYVEHNIPFENIKSTKIQIKF